MQTPMRSKFERTVIAVTAMFLAVLTGSIITVLCIKAHAATNVLCLCLSIPALFFGGITLTTDCYGFRPGLHDRVNQWLEVIGILGIVVMFFLGYVNTPIGFMKIW